MTPGEILIHDDDGRETCTHVRAKYEVIYNEPWPFNTTETERPCECKSLDRRPWWERRRSSRRAT